MRYNLSSRQSTVQRPSSIVHQPLHCDVMLCSVTFSILPTIFLDNDCRLLFYYRVRKTWQSSVCKFNQIKSCFNKNNALFFGYNLIINNWFWDKREKEAARISTDQNLSVKQLILQLIQRIVWNCKRCVHNEHKTHLDKTFHINLFQKLR